MIGCVIPNHPSTAYLSALFFFTILVVFCIVYLMITRIVLIIIGNSSCRRRDSRSISTGTVALVARSVVVAVAVAAAPITWAVL